MQFFWKKLNISAFQQNISRNNINLKSGMLSNRSAGANMNKTSFTFNRHGQEFIQNGILFSITSPDRSILAL